MGYLARRGLLIAHAGVAIGLSPIPFFRWRKDACICLVLARRNDLITGLPT